MKTFCISASARSKRLYRKLHYNSKSMHSLWTSRNMTQEPKPRAFQCALHLKVRIKHKYDINFILTKYLSLSLALENLISFEQHVKPLISHILDIYVDYIYTFRSKFKFISQHRLKRGRPQTSNGLFSNINLFSKMIFFFFHANNHDRASNDGYLPLGTRATCKLTAR